MRLQRARQIAHSKQYAILFGTMMGVAFVAPVFPTGSVADLVIRVLVSFALLAGVYVIAQIGRVRVFMYTLVAAALILNWTGLAFKEAFAVSASVRMIFFATLTWVVFVDVLYGGKLAVSERLFGAASVYLLMAFTWADAYLLLQHFQPEAFTSTLGRDGAGYFSLVTQTTLGYGDISPLWKPARALATMQSTVGALYIAILVARLAGLEAKEGIEESAESAESDAS